MTRRSCRNPDNLPGTLEHSLTTSTLVHVASSHTMEFPLPPGAKAPDDPKRLNEDEISFIFRTTLLPEHRDDANILRFILEYCRTRDMREACQLIGIKVQSGQALRNRSDIFKCIEAITARAVFKYGIDPAAIVQKVNEIVEFDPIELENTDGTFKKHMKDLPGAARRAIKKLRVRNIWDTDPNGMKICTGEILEYEFHDKLKAAELVGREQDLFKEKKVIEHDMTKNMSSILLESKKRAENRVIDVTPKPLEIIPAPQTLPLPPGYKDE